MTPIFDLRRQLEFYFFSLLILIAFVYGCWRIYPLISGPKITVSSPIDGEMVSSTTFQVLGHVSHVKNISLQGRPIPVDKNGNFAEIIVGQKPYTKIVFNATDFYDKTITKTITVLPVK